MAKTKTSKQSSSVKVSFGAKKTGVMKKSYGPKEQRPKRYKGQGR